MRFGVLAAGLLSAQTAAAHSLGLAGGDFLGGLLHPFIDPLQLLALVALAISGAQRGVHRMQWTLVAAPLLVLLAGLSGQRLNGPPAGDATGVMAAVMHGETVLYAMAAILGLAIAGARPLPGWLIHPLAALLALALAGIALAELAGRPTVNPLAYLGGSALGVFLLLAYALYGADRLLADAPWWRTMAVRVVGSWIAAAGLILLSLRLFGPSI